MVVHALVAALAVTVTCASAALDVRVEPAARNVPAYRVSLINRSSRTLLAIQYEAYRGSARVLSGRRKMERNEPLALPGRRDAFEIQLGPSSAGPDGAPERVAITSVLWDDGLVEGDPGLLADERMIDIGKAAQIRRVLQLIRGASATASEPGDVRARLAALPTTGDLLRAASTQIGMQQVKDSALKDLDAFEFPTSQRGATSFGTWLADMTASYEEWLARVVAR